MAPLQQLRGPGCGRSRINTGGNSYAGTGGAIETVAGSINFDGTADLEEGGAAAAVTTAGAAPGGGNDAGTGGTTKTATEAGLVSEGTGGLQSSPTRIAAATSLVNLNLGTEISKALDEMFPPLGNSQEYAMTHLPQFQGDAVSANGDC